MDLIAKRWSAVSDGGEDQGAEEVIVYGAEEGEEFITSVLERAVSRDRLFLFSAETLTHNTPSPPKGR